MLAADDRPQTLVWALALSIGLHVLALTFLPNLKFDQKVEDKTLTVELLPPPPPPAAEPAPVSEPEPQPVREKPKPVVKPKPVPKPIPKEAPAPVSEPPPSDVAETQPPAPPPAMTATPVEEPKPTFKAPPPPEPPKGPSQADIDDARNLYGGLLSREIAKHKQYPRIAQMRGWQGEATIELKIDGSGTLLSSRIVTSSGHDVLDKQGLEMVRKASPFPPPPEALRGRNFEILVPVSFKLE